MRGTRNKSEEGRKRVKVGEREGGSLFLARPWRCSSLAQMAKIVDRSSTTVNSLLTIGTLGFVKLTSRKERVAYVYGISL